MNSLDSIQAEVLHSLFLMYKDHPIPCLAEEAINFQKKFMQQLAVDYIRRSTDGTRN